MQEENTYLLYYTPIFMEDRQSIINNIIFQNKMYISLYWNLFFKKRLNT